MYRVQLLNTNATYHYNFFTHFSYSTLTDDLLTLISAMSCKRKCPFSNTSPQQFKTHITLKEAAKSDDQLMKQMMDRTRTLLLDGQQKYWHDSKGEEKLADDVTLLCYTCTCAPPSTACSHCYRHFCSPCSRRCTACGDMFCTLCSVLNYDQVNDRAFCLACSP